MRRLAKWVLIGAGAAVVVAGVVAFQYQRKIAYRILAPDVTYGEMRIIPRPVYLFMKWWAAHPDLDDFADHLPAGLDLVDTQADAPADVFFFHPTTHFGEDWNADADDPAAAAIVDGLVMAAQASVFNGCCRVFAPRYRQAHAATFVNSSANGRNALELAFVDSLRAFEEYLREWNDGRPFIIAGHSQGAAMALRVIDEKLDGPPLRKLFVGAYILGAGVPLDRFGNNFETIEACETATDFGCIISWETYIAGTDPTINPAVIEEFYERHWVTLVDEPRNCINPLTWSREAGRAEASLNLGALPFNPDVTPGWGLVFGGTPDLDPADFAVMPAPLPGYTGAECKDGFLFVEEPQDDAFRGLMLGDGNLHAYDFGLFYMNIRQNAQDRVAAYLAAQEVAP